MTSLHNSSQPMGTCRGTALLQLLNIVNDDHIGCAGISNVETSPVAPHFSTLPINSKLLLMKNVVAPNLGGSLIQCFSRLTQRVVFAFLRGEGQAEELPCLDSPDEKMPAVEKDDQEITQVKDVVPSQSSIFDFLKGDVRQFLIFLVDLDLGSRKMDISNLDAYESLSKNLSLLDLCSSSDGSACLVDTRHSIQDNGSSSTTSHELQLTNNYAKVHDDVEWMKTDAIVKNDGFTREIDENILYSPFHYWQKMFKDDPLSGLVQIYETHQCHGIENCSELLLNHNAGVFGHTFNFALENHGLIIEKNHKETVAGTPNLLSSSEKGSLISNQALVDKENYKNSDSTLRFPQCSDDLSDSKSGWTTEIRNRTISHCKRTDSLNDCGTSGYTSNEEFGTHQQHPAIGNIDQLKFSIPNPDKLMDFLHGSLSSPKFLTSDPLNRNPDNCRFSSPFVIRNSDEVAKSDSLSASHTNSSHGNRGNDNEYGMFDTFGYATESGIGAMTGSFGEIETCSTPSLPDTSQIEKIRWNWSSRAVDSSAFDFDEHELELYGLSERDVQANDDELCDSPTWPGKS